MQKLSEEEITKIYDLILDSGLRGISFQDVREKSQISQFRSNKILNELRDEGKIYFSTSLGKWKSVDYKTEHETQSMEWCAW